MVNNNRDTRIVRVGGDVYQKAKDMAKAERITVADAVTRMVQQGDGGPPTACELANFEQVLRDQGLTPPRRPDWVWGLTNVMPPDILRGTKMEPYARAREEAELRCSLGNELYEKLVAGELDAEQVQAAAEELSQAAEPAAEPAAEE